METSEAATRSVMTGSIDELERLANSAAAAALSLAEALREARDGSARDPPPDTTRGSTTWSRARSEREIPRGSQRRTSTHTSCGSSLFLQSPPRLSTLSQDFTNDVRQDETTHPDLSPQPLSSAQDPTTVPLPPSVDTDRFTSLSVPSNLSPPPIPSSNSSRVELGRVLKPRTRHLQRRLRQRLRELFDVSEEFGGLLDADDAFTRLLDSDLHSSPETERPTRSSGERRPARRQLAASPLPRRRAQRKRERPLDESPEDLSMVFVAQPRPLRSFAQARSPTGFTSTDSTLSTQRGGESERTDFVPSKMLAKAMRCPEETRRFRDSALRIVRDSKPLEQLLNENKVPTRRAV